ncbi:MAG: RNA methyltransferase [Nitrospirae bacterium]|nr:RNA methyltransferase [Nitrospirota bacterium]
MPLPSRVGPVSLNLLKRYKTLATKKGRLDLGLFLVEGNRAIGQIITSHPDAIVEIIATEEQVSLYGQYPVRIATPKQFQSICLTKTPQGVMAVVRQPAGIYTDRLPDRVGAHVLLLEDIQDPGNVGTLIRTAAAFGYSGVMLSDQCADPLSPKSVQAAAGTVLSVWMRRTGGYLDLVKALKDGGHLVVSADLNGDEEPSIVCGREKLMLALGNEASGPSSALIGISDYRFKIPIRRDRAESLNVAGCGAIGMYLSSIPVRSP